MAVTIKDIAREVGVSPATVSLALNNSDMVSANTARLVKEAAERMGYVRNVFARSLVKGHSVVLGLIVPDIENPFYASLVNQVNLAAGAAGYEISIQVTNDDAEKERKTLRHMMQQSVDAILLAPVNSTPCTGEYLEWLNSAHEKPIIFLSTRYKQARLPCVCIDLVRAVYHMTRHMIAKGARSLALLSGPEGVDTLDMRCEGFLNAVREAGVPHEIWHTAGVDYRSAYDFIKLRGLAAFPEGMVCISDMMALAAYNLLTEWGMSVPGDALLSGLDDGLIASIAPVPLTTINPNLPAMARAVIDAVQRAIGGEQLERDINVEYRLAIRRSTGG